MIGSLNNKPSEKHKKRKLYVQLLANKIEETEDTNNKNIIATNNTKNKKNKEIITEDDIDPYNECAGPLTLQSCQCMHIQEYLPIQLSSLSSSSLLNNDNIIHKLHLLQYLHNQDKQEEETNMMFGEEELRRILSIYSLESYYPLVSTYDKIKLLQQLQDKEIKEDKPTKIVVKKEGGRNAKQLPNLSKQYNKKNVCTITSAEDDKKLLDYKNKEEELLNYRSILDNRKNNVLESVYSQDNLSKLPNILKNKNAIKDKMVKLSIENEELLKQASSVDKWLEVYRMSRVSYWRRLGKVFDDDGVLNCQWCDDCNIVDDDQLMICLECAAIGCGPGSIYPNSNQCMMTHLLLSGHNFAVTCGNKANLYCFKCGDFIYHKVFTVEKLRIDIAQHIPYLSWKESGVLQRSAKPGRFLLHSEIGNGGVVWTGMEATYPNRHLSSPCIITAAKLTWKRYCIFHNNLLDSMIWNNKAIKLALKLKKVRIQAPVGMYNLGNTCFMSCILQCLIHTTPLQRYFLIDIGHDYQACTLIRNSSDYSCFLPTTPNNTITNATTCLACEMDKIYLQMLGSSIGHDCIEALEEYKKSKVVLDTFDNLPSDPLIYCRDDNDAKLQYNIKSATDAEKLSQVTSSKSRKKGKPFIPINFLTAAWKVDEMKHLKGYEQRDAHEFLHAFLDTCGRNMKLYRDVICKMTGKPQQNDNFIQSLFGGTFCSVLFCEKCGCKRLQKEPYLIVSLPFRKDKSSSSTHLPNNVTTSSPSETTTQSSNNTTTSSNQNNTSPSRNNISSGITRSKSKDRKVDIQTCLENFTSAQSLADCVHCPSCNSFTPTLQQHTFSTFPKVLCLHLKRFDALTNKKITDPVIFPAFGLDMGPFLSHWRELVVQDEVSPSNKPNDKNEDEKKLWNESSPKVLYDLFATVDHSGTLHQGHYVANVKVDGNWFHCNDAFVSHSDSATGDCGDAATCSASGEKEVLESESAYILFYIKR